VQILDDLNDLGQDLAGRRQNYFASVIAHGADAGERARLEALEGAEAVREDAALWKRFPKGLARTQGECLSQFRAGVDLLCRGGLALSLAERSALAAGLAAVVRHPPLAARLRAGKGPPGARGGEATPRIFPPSPPPARLKQSSPAKQGTMQEEF
jgi:hypothetical protein